MPKSGLFKNAPRATAEQARTPHGGSELFGNMLLTFPPGGGARPGDIPGRFPGTSPVTGSPVKADSHKQRDIRLYTCVRVSSGLGWAAHTYRARRRGARWRGAGRWLGGARPLTVARGRAGAARRRRRRGLESGQKQLKKTQETVFTPNTQYGSAALHGLGPQYGLFTTTYD